MSSQCIDLQCKRTSRAICKCCNRDLCLQHFLQHNDLILSQINALKKTMTDVDSRFKLIDVAKSANLFRQQLKQWRIDSYTTIDRYYESKSQELNRVVQDKVDYQRETMNQLKKRIDEFIESEYGKQEEIDLVKTKLNDLNGNIDLIEKTSITMTTSPLVIDQDFIQIKK